MTTLNWTSFAGGALFTLFIILLAVALYTAEPSQTATTQASGTINTSLTIQPSYIDWGTVLIGEPVMRNITFTNNGATWQSLNMTMGNHTANLLNYTLSWDAENHSLPTATSLTANFTLTIHEANITVTDQFTFDIRITDKG